MRGKKIRGSRAALALGSVALLTGSLFGVAYADEQSGDFTTDATPLVVEEPAENLDEPEGTQEDGENEDPGEIPVEGTEGEEVTTPDGPDQTPQSVPAPGGRMDLQSDGGISPFSVTGTPPYLVWEVTGATGRTGAIFKLEGPAVNNSNWGTAYNVPDCTAEPCAGPDLDPEPGKFLVEQIGSHRIRADRRYRLTPVLPPTNYTFSSGSTAARQISGSGQNPSPNPWTNQTYDFGAFATTPRASTHVPSCAAGTLYSIRDNGQIAQVVGTSISTFGGVPSAGGTVHFNGLGIGVAGTPVIAYNRTGGTSYNIANFWQFNSDGTWTNLNHSQTTGVALIAGAVCLYCDQYFFGGFKNNGQQFELYRFDPATNQSYPVGTVQTPTTGLGTGTADSWNGDISFDAVGNMYIVRGRSPAGTNGLNMSVITVPRSQIAAAGSMANPSINTTISNTGVINSAVNMGQINGVTFDSNGHLFVADGSRLMRYTMPNATGGTQIGGNSFLGGSSTDLSGCGSPPTIELRKDLPAGRFAQGDQFKLDLSLFGVTPAWAQTATTTGTASGVQEVQVGPYPVTAGQSYTHTESSVPASSLAGYDTSRECWTEKPDGTTTPLSSTALGDTSGRVTIPAAEAGSADGAAVICQFTNTPKGTVTWQKTDGEDETNTAVLGGSEWRITRTNPATPSFSLEVKDCVAGTAAQCDPDDHDIDPTEGKFKVEGLGAGTYNLVETKAPEGYVLDPTPRQFTISSTNLDASVAAANTRNYSQPTIELKKETCGTINPVNPDDPSGDTPCVTEESPEPTWTPAEGWSLEVVGHNASNPSAGPDGWSATNGDGSAGTWTLGLEDATADNKVTIREKDDHVPPMRLQEIECISSEDETRKFTNEDDEHGNINNAQLSAELGELEAGVDWTCTFRNRLVRGPQPGQVTWDKVGEEGGRLAGSEWELTGPIGRPTEATYEIKDCVAESDEACEPTEIDPEVGLTPANGDRNHLAGGFRVEGLLCGDWELVETKAPLGYQKLTEPISFTINGVCNSAGTVDPHYPIGNVVNLSAAPDLPLTGGASAFTYVVVGGGLLGLAVLAGAALRNRRGAVR